MIDRNLWRQSQSRRGLLLASWVCGVLCAGVILWQAFTLAGILDAVFLHKAILEDTLPAIRLLLLLVTIRFGLQVLEEHFSFLLGQGVQYDLRQALLQKVSAMGPVALRQEQRGQLLYLMNEGIGTLESYYSKYLPQLFQSAVIPVLFLIFIFPRDLTSGVILLLTAPLVPFFMMLIGKWTNKVNAQQWKIINRLSGYLHDVMAGLTTLKLMNRSAEQSQKIQAVGQEYAQATLAVLRWAFLSSLALELFTTISIALVSVGLGLRLVEGKLDFATAFFILLIAPEFYQPLRALGGHFHTSLNTRQAAAEIFAFLGQPVYTVPVACDPLQQDAIRFEHVTVRYPNCEQPALKDVTFTVQPGEIVALAGRSGSGKTTVLNVLQGFLCPENGKVSVQQLPTVIQQKPYMMAGTILDNLRLGSPQLSEEKIMQVCRQTGLDELLQSLPDGLYTQIGQGGIALSGGQRQMVAIVRAICQQRKIVLFDEATANLDLVSERQLNQSLHQLLQGRTVLLVAHRFSTLQMADRVVVLEQGYLAEQGSREELLRQNGVYSRLVRGGAEL
ncbi:MAG: thiol reductant ABC exporter subunit CydD [Peptococcaceae bacterium]